MCKFFALALNEINILVLNIYIYQFKNTTNTLIGFKCCHAFVKKSKMITKINKQIISNGSDWLIDFSQRTILTIEILEPAVFK